VANIIYYKKVFFIQTGFDKNGFEFDLGQKLLILGRMVFQLVIPTNYSTQYNPASSLGMWGLGIFGTIFVISYSRISREIFIQAWSLFFIIFFTLYHKGSNIFFLNTYLLYPLVAMLMILGCSLIRVKCKRWKYFVLIGLFLQSSFYGNLRSSQTDFYAYLADNEKSCSMIQAAVIASMIEGRVDNFKTYSKKWLQAQCRIINKRSFLYPLFLMTNMVYFDDEMSRAKRRALIKSRVASRLDFEMITLALDDKEGVSEAELLKKYLKIEGMGDIGSIFYAQKLILEDYFKRSCKTSEACRKMRELMLRNKKLDYEMKFHKL
jgi:hypothetical protein